MSIPAWLIAVVRSLVQAGVSALVSAAWFSTLADWLATNAGIELTQVQIEAAGFTIAFALVVGATNWLGKQEAFQWLNQVISLFLSNSAAVYDKTEAAGATGQDDVSVDMGGEEGAFGGTGSTGAGIDRGVEGGDGE